MANLKTCGNCFWSEQDEHEREHNPIAYHCYLNPPVLLESGASSRPMVYVDDKACNKWEEQDDE